MAKEFIIPTCYELLLSKRQITSSFYFHIPYDMLLSHLDSHLHPKVNHVLSILTNFPRKNMTKSQPSALKAK